VKGDEVGDFDVLLAEIRACRICAEFVPLGPRPIVRANPAARLLIVGQAPGTKAHESGTPWNDASGRRLRDWLGLSDEIFYDTGKVAIMPAGFCYPGRDSKGGDKPPRPECAPLWHPKVLPYLTKVTLTLLVGGYAQKLFLGDRAAGGVSATVERWRDFLPEFITLPHPSWRTLGWEKKNPWFAAELLPELRTRTRHSLL
jgi:uracil-DNA glycosylase